VRCSTPAWRTLIDNLPDYIFIKDAQSRFVMVNRAQAVLLGVRSPDEAVGTTDQDFLPAALAAQTAPWCTAL